MAASQSACTYSEGGGGRGTSTHRSSVTIGFREAEGFWPTAWADRWHVSEDEWSLGIARLPPTGRMATRRTSVQDPGCEYAVIVVAANTVASGNDWTRPAILIEILTRNNAEWTDKCHDSV